MGGFADSKDSARSIAKNAFEIASTNPFNISKLNEAMVEMQRAYEMNPNEPWVYMTASLFPQIQAYRIGNWNEKSAYDPALIDEALASSIESVKKAIKLDPNFVRAYTRLAYLYIIDEKYMQAEMYLSKATKIDSSEFYIYIYEGDIAIKLKRYTKAEKYYGNAKKYIRDNTEDIIVRERIADLAKLTHNFSLEEKMYIENIKLDPKNAYKYGNYANFLYSHGRYEEAIKYYKIAIAITPYGNAKTWLKKAEEALAEQQKKR